MYIPSEIIVLFFLISFLVYTMPTVLVKFSRTLKGKFLLIILTIVVTLYNRTGGLLMAMLFIFLSEFNYEFNNGITYEGFSDVEIKKKHDKLTIDESLKPRDSASLFKVQNI
jgi:hypothetical protein